MVFRLSKEDDSRTETEAERPRIKILTPRPESIPEPASDEKPLKGKALKKKKKVDLEEEVERLGREMQQMQASMKSLMCIYQTVRTSGLNEPPLNKSSANENPLTFSQLFQSIRALENEMDRIASIYLSDDQPTVTDHRKLDSLYQEFVELLLKGTPQLSQSSLTLESLQEDEGMDILDSHIEPDEGDGYSPEDESEMLRSMRMAQQIMESMLMSTARSIPVTGKDLDTLDHWYQVFASFR